MDRERFSEICGNTEQCRCNSGGIGTLSEKTMHAVLKYYLEPDVSRHEIRVGTNVVDILEDDGIIEIQTRNFFGLKKKFDALLAEYPITVVYPIAHVKWLCWIDPESGEVTKRRKSPKTGSACDCFLELRWILPYLKSEHLRFRILLIDLVEYRYLDGWSRNKKSGSTRYERVPESLYDEILIEKSEDFQKLMPENLPEPFTSAEFSKAAQISIFAARTGLRILFAVGAVEKCGKQKNAILYRKTASPPKAEPEAEVSSPG
ncbi:MAG TPA: hypothetical protein PKY19_07415 [Oscillospiraceae bacterium]|nr:hypothetical protein [Oscillospiraceae bacterium]HXK78289.1 hypothetical protein [Oscillospiraceae bacterium]